MAPGLLSRPRSKRRCLLLLFTASLLWLYSPAGMVLPGMDLFLRPAVYSQSLDHLQKPLCPRFYKYDRQKLLLLEPNECTPLPSEHPEFSADICFSPFTCNEGLVRVRRRDRELCKKANLRYPLSNNATHDAFHRQFSGPDSFHVVFSGSEKLSPPDWYHAGQCLYVFPFHISNPGKLTLDIMHLYDNYGAIVEQTDQWPVLRQQKVISNLPLEICRGCPTRVAQPRFPVSDYSEQSREVRSIRGRYQFYSAGKASLSAGKESQLPQCSRTMAVQGAWLPAHPLDKQSWRKANYTWTPLGCTFGKPLNQTCLERKKDTLKILFQGDTHLRVAMEHLLRRLNETKEIQTYTATTSPRIEQQVSGSATLAFVDDPWFSKIAEKSDFLVANLGQWATGTKTLDSLWSTARYHDRIQELVEDLQQCARDIQDFDDEDMEFARQLLDSDFGRENDGTQRKENQGAIRKQDTDVFRDNLIGQKEQGDQGSQNTKKTRPSHDEDRVKTDEDRPHYLPNGFLRQSKHISPPSALLNVVDGQVLSNAGNGGREKYSDHDERGSRAHLRRVRRSLDTGGHDHGDRVSPLKMVWAGMLAYPETQRVDPGLRHDWRTIYRLRYWNQIAEDVMLLHKVPFMDFFSMTLSMIDTSPDRSHYFGTDAAEAMLEELAFKLGLCEVDS